MLICKSFIAYIQTWNGISPHQYLIKVRIDRSKYLLTNTKYTLNEIVEIVGFECPSSFIRLFKTMNSITPGKYRLNLHKLI